MVVIGYMDLSTITLGFVKNGGSGMSGGEGGQNWARPCLLVAASGVIGNAAPNWLCEGLIVLFIRESFFDIAACSVPTNGATYWYLLLRRRILAFLRFSRMYHSSWGILSRKGHCGLDDGTYSETKVNKTLALWIRVNALDYEISLISLLGENYLL